MIVERKFIKMLDHHKQIKRMFHKTTKKKREKKAKSTSSDKEKKINCELQRKLNTFSRTSEKQMNQ